VSYPASIKGRVILPPQREDNSQLHTDAVSYPASTKRELSSLHEERITLSYILKL